MTTDEWPCLISFALDPLRCSEQAGIENICLQPGFEPTQRHATIGESALNWGYLEFYSIPIYEYKWTCDNACMDW